MKQRKKLISTHLFESFWEPHNNDEKTKCDLNQTRNTSQHPNPFKHYKSCDFFDLQFQFKTNCVNVVLTPTKCNIFTPLSCFVLLRPALCCFLLLSVACALTEIRAEAGIRQVRVKTHLKKPALLESLHVKVAWLKHVEDITLSLCVKRAVVDHSDKKTSTNNTFIWIVGLQQRDDKYRIIGGWVYFKMLFKAYSVSHGLVQV